MSEGPDDRVNHQLQLRLQQGDQGDEGALTHISSATCAKSHGVRGPCCSTPPTAGNQQTIGQALNAACTCSRRKPSSKLAAHRAHGEERLRAVVGDGAQQREELEAVLRVVLQDVGQGSTNITPARPNSSCELCSHSSWSHAGHSKRWRRSRDLKGRPRVRTSKLRVIICSVHSKTAEKMRGICRQGNAYH
jgi:hypothetical protein